MSAPSGGRPSGGAFVFFGEGRRPMSTAAGIPHTFFTRSAVMRELATRIEQAAGTDAPLLVEGEPGAGKSFMAFLLHAQSARRATPLLRVNCAGLPGELLGGDLFGYERRAFPGATRGKPGKFALAHEGTLLLEEIGSSLRPYRTGCSGSCRMGHAFRWGARGRSAWTSGSSRPLSGRSATP